MLKEINIHAGAVDGGSETFHAAVYGGPMKVFGTFTSDLQVVVKFFKDHGVHTVAMEATGVYWMPLYEALIQAGLTVCMVNGAHVKNVPGRKTDVADCQWLAELHAHGLLEAGFVPAAPILRLRDYQRLRQDHIEMGSQHILHMQKALERMNVKVHDVLSQLTGFSGLQIIGAILRGERDPAKLADLCDGRRAILQYPAAWQRLVEQGLKAYEEKYRRDSIRRLQAAARKFGLEIIEPASATA